MFQFNNNGKIEEYSLEQVKLAAEKAGLDFNAYIDKHNIKEKPGKTQPTTQKGAEPVDVMQVPELTLTESPSVDTSLALPKLEQPKTGTDAQTEFIPEPTSSEELNKIENDYISVGEINVEKENKNKKDSKLFRFKKGKFTIDERDEYLNWKDGKGLFSESENLSIDEVNEKSQAKRTAFLADLPSYKRQDLYFKKSKIYEEESKKFNIELSRFNIENEEIEKQISLFNSSNNYSKDDFLKLKDRIEALKTKHQYLQGLSKNLNDKNTLQILDDFKRDYSKISKLENAFETLAVDLAMGPMAVLDMLKSEEGRKKSYTSDLIDYRAALAEEAGQDLAKPIEVSSISDWNTFGTWAADGLINFIPSGLMASSGAAAMPLFFLSGFGSKMSDFALGKRNAVKNIPALETAIEQEKDPKAKTKLQNQLDLERNYLTVSDATRLLTATAYGTSEFIFEIPTIRAIRDISNVSELIAKNGFKKALAKSVAAYPAGVGMESTSEGLTTLTQNISDIHIFGDKTKSYFDGVDEAAAQGALIGNGFKSINVGMIAQSAVRDVIATKSDKAAIQKRVDKVNNLTTQLTNKNLTQEEKSSIQKEINNEIKDLKDDQDISSARFLRLNGEQQQQVFEYDRLSRKEIERWNQLGASENIDESTKDELRKEIVDKINKHQSDKQGLLDSSDGRLKPYKKLKGDNEVRIGDEARNILIAEKEVALVEQHNKTTKAFDKIEFAELDAGTEATWDDGSKTITINTAVLGSNPHVVLHEYTHAVITKEGFSQKDFDAIKGEVLNEFERKKENGEFTDKQYNRAIAKYNLYKNSKDQSEELLTAIGEQIASNQVRKSDESFLNNLAYKIKQAIGTIVGKEEADNFRMDTAQDAFNFVNQLTKSVYGKRKLTVPTGGDVEQPQEGKKESKSEKDLYTNTEKTLGITKGPDGKVNWDGFDEVKALSAGYLWRNDVERRLRKYKNFADFDQYKEDIISDVTIGDIKGARGVVDIIRRWNPDLEPNIAKWINGQIDNKILGVVQKRGVGGDFKLDVTEAKGVTDTTTEEATERIEEVKPAERVSLRKQLGLDETIKPTVVNAVKKTFGTKLPKVTSPKFRPELEKRFRTELKKPLAKLMGRTEDYRSFLSNNFEVLYNAIPQTVINRRFNEFAEPVVGKDGKPLREKTAVGKGIFKKKKIVKAEWIKYFLGDNVGRSTQGTRKTALAEALAEQFAFDATMEVLADPQVIGKVKEISELIQQPVPENMIEQVSDMLDRPSQFKFSLNLFTVNGNEKADSVLDRQFRLYDEKGAAGIVVLINNGFEKSDIIRIKSIDDIQIITEQLPKITTLMPKEAWYSILTKPNYKMVSGGTKEQKKALFKIYKESIELILEDANTVFGKNVKGVDKFTFSNYNTAFGKTPEAINEKNKSGDIEKVNKKNTAAWRSLWKNTNKLIKQDRALAPIIEWFYNLSVNNGLHPHRQGAEMVAWSMNPKGIKSKLYDWEHAMPSTGAYAYLLDSALKTNRDFEQDLNAVQNNYKLIALDAADHANLNKTFLKAQMTVGWKVFSGSYLERYFNPVLFKAFGGIDPSGIMLTNGKTIKQQFRIEADGKIYDVKPEPSIKESKNLDTEFNQLLQATTGVEYYKEFSPAKARLVGRGKGKRKFFIPYSADDFVGLLYATLGEGKVGDKQMAWYEENLLRPFSRGIQQYEVAKQKAMREWMTLSSQIKKDVPGGLNKRNDTGFRNQDSLRMYIWAKQGMDVPGTAKSDVSDAVALVSNNPKLKEFAERLIALNPDGYPAPGQSWDAGDITTDIVSYVNDVRRGEFLTEWKQNVDQIFTDKNKQKLLASYGQNYIDALEDILHRMKTGRNRKFGTTKAERAFMDWTNNSVGAIMFFNARSAVLQTLSAVNFINFSDNNPINAGLAFANQPQYWKDFSTLFNSDFLKQRRSGLQTDVNADEIANAAKSSSNKAKAALSAILKLGFTPTQIADSFAIASGGATFYRNRVKKYIKDGLDKEAAEKKAFTDFQEVAEETQQSARPDRISSQQASSLGRLVLAFGNTPMQYARLTKKASLDLINGRGDWKTNISKIAYYSVIQNIIFSSLQQGLFALLFDEEDDEKEKSRYFRIGNSSFDTLLRGAGVYGAAAATVKNMVLEIIEQSEKSRPDYTKVAMEATALSPPINSKLRKLESAGKTFTYKQSKEKVFTEGFSFENPGFLAAGKTISALTNLPADRVVQKADHIHTAMQDETELWQAIALSLGWSEWDLNMIEKKTKGSATPTRRSRTRTRTRNRTRSRKRN